MLFRNYTPFPPLLFESRDEKRQDFGVVVLRGTFEIRQGRRLGLVPVQEPLVMADEYFGDPGDSSLRIEGSLAPFKPRTDVTVTADAVAPEGVPREGWPCAVAFGSARASVYVTGPRRWSRTLGVWSASRIEPARRVPLRYEYAYGGAFESDDGPVRFAPNPVGRGFVHPGTREPVPIPQVLPHRIDRPKFGEEIAVAGFGPIAPSWEPRSARAGTYNAIWRKTRWPDLPEDFSFDFYSCAAAGLTLPEFAKGDEEVRLTHLSEDPELTFQLPGFELATLLRFASGELVPAPLHLDSVHVDVPSSRAFLTWRGMYPLHAPLRVLEVRMRAPEEYIDNGAAPLREEHEVARG